ncbi:MAG: ATP-binding cassette domain-containing protein [Planctomycetes bacterium]|nr:ATP-binding cassette domain-containing protein [Planctomycetota bacterium]
MIQVENLSKSYGPALALDSISFEVERGEVVGFLGPNGAGKSTTMKILTGFLLPSSGRASVDGLDVVEQSLEVRRRIGYLPESTPLYTEMRVDEYLRFAAEIRGVERGRMRSAVSRVVELCGLERVTGKNIIELSKGYKQRVGLAQAMVHEPDLLVLDEPTSGLDPNQIVEVRDLIRRLGEEHTVILSTHYLQEVEASCNRVIIVNLGKIVADSTADELVATMPCGPIAATIRGDKDAVLSQLGELVPTDGGIELKGAVGDRVDVEVKAGETASPGIEEAIAALVVKNGWGLVSLGRRASSLEDVFRSLTTSDRGVVTHA